MVHPFIHPTQPDVGSQRQWLARQATELNKYTNCTHGTIPQRSGFAYAWGFILDRASPALIDRMILSTRTHTYYSMLHSSQGLAEVYKVSIS